MSPDEIYSAFLDLGIQGIKSGGGELQYTTCPKCSYNRKKKNDSCLSVNMTEGWYKCNHCQEFKGNVVKANTKPKFQKPDRKNITQLSDKGLQYFIKRKIGPKVVIANKVAESKMKNTKGWILYPYIQHGILVNNKLRNPEAKDFRQQTGARQIMSNYDRCFGQLEIVVCEGEEEGMTWETALGFTAHTTVSQGAPGENDSQTEKKLECITNSLDMFAKAKTIYIATDNDPSGERLAKELVRRLGAERCKRIDFGKYKDANEAWNNSLMNKGLIQKFIDDAKFVKIAGVFQIKDVREKMLHQFRHGMNKGTTTYFPNLDKKWKWRMGEVNLMSGYAGEGKTTFELQKHLIKAVKEGWKFGIFSPENFPPHEFFDDLVHTLVGKSTDKDNPKVMTEEEYNWACDIIDSLFYMVYPENDDFDIDTILDCFKTLVRRYGIRGAIIDPYNMVEHKMEKFEREDHYIIRFITKLKRFAAEQDIAMTLIAHQKTPDSIDNKTKNYPTPNIYKTSGGGAFKNKIDNAMWLWRPLMLTDEIDTQAIFCAEKLKKHKLTGKPGRMDFYFDEAQNRYFDKETAFSPFTSISMPGSNGVEAPAPVEEVAAVAAAAMDDDDLPF